MGPRVGGGAISPATGDSGMPAGWGGGGISEHTSSLEALALFWLCNIIAGIIIILGISGVKWALFVGASFHLIGC